MQHLPVVFDVHRITFIDDDVGGAVETGTFLARSVAGNLSVMGPSQLSLEQGLEVPALADIFLRNVSRLMSPRSRTMTMPPCRTVRVPVLEFPVGASQLMFKSESMPAVSLSGYARTPAAIGVHDCVP